MRRPIWLWIVVGLYGLVGVTNLRTAFQAALGAETGMAEMEARGVLVVAALLSGAAACLAALWAIRGQARAIPASLVFLVLFIGLAVWSTAVEGFATRWGALIFWVALFSTMSFFLRVAKQRGHLA